jgi:hypothetical protein
MSIYLDESIHTQANFIVLAAVMASDEQIQQAEKALSACGFIPGQDEFKSTMKMAGNASAQQLRERFQEIIGQCKIAIGVCAVHERDQLMPLAGRIIEAITHHGSYAEQTVYLDQGMKSYSVKLPDGFTLETGCDSKSVVGIQLADCCAHFVSSIILGEMDLFKKNGASQSRLPWQSWRTGARMGALGFNPICTGWAGASRHIGRLRRLRAVEEAFWHGFFWRLRRCGY